MKGNNVLLLFIILSGLIICCSKNDSNTDQTSITLGTKNLGFFTPKTTKAYNPLDGYVIQLVADTVSINILLPQLKPGSYTITTQKINSEQALFNIGFKSAAFSATEGTITVTDTSNNSISGSYTITNSTKSVWSDDHLKISDGKFNKVQRESFQYASVEDYEHNQYKTIQIGTQTWMAENLRSWVYSNGDSIEQAYRYNKSDSLMKIYGLFYTWNAATHSNNIEMTQGACPAGWHLPSNSEWQQLLTQLGAENMAGGKLKSLTSWNIPNGWADNGSGFSALGAGIHNPLTEYPDFAERMGIQSYFWSSTFDQSTGGLSTAWSVGLDYGGSGAFRSPYYRTDMGFSIRCVKN